MGAAAGCARWGAGGLTRPAAGEEAAGTGRPTSPRTRPISACVSKGLAMWPSAPAARARPSSKASKVPARRSTGTSLREGSAFNAWHAWYPSMRGMAASARTTSGFRCLAWARSSSPSPTVVTSKPSPAKVISTTLRMVTESSAKRRCLVMVFFRGLATGRSSAQVL